MNNTSKFLLVLLLGCLTFWLGMTYQKFIYKDICLDMGGGLNPGGYPICVIEKYNEKPIENAGSVKTNLMVDTFSCGSTSKIISTYLNEEVVMIEVVDDAIKMESFYGIIVPAGSGGKYKSFDQKYTYWNKDNECMLIENEGLKNEKTLFQSCKTK